MGQQGSNWVRSRPVAALLGLFAGGMTILLVESLGHALFGTADPTDLASVTLPMFLSVLVGWTVGSGVGGAVATYWSRARSGVIGLVVGLVLLAAAGSNMLVIEHPLWMAVAAVVLMPGAAWLAGRSLSTVPGTGAA